DIPWNPMRLEQRNGRVDRHNQARDVLVFHYTTEQQSDLEFLARVIKKVDQVREDLGSVGQVFDEALERLSSFQGNSVSDEELDRRITDIRSTAFDREDITTCDGGQALDYRETMKKFEDTSERLKLSPKTLGHLFVQGMLLAGGKVDEVAPQIFRIVSIPPEYKQLIDDTLVITRGPLQGALPKVTFDTAVLEKVINGRKIYRTKLDTILLRLNHPLMKRLLGQFERHMWGENTEKVTRWTVIKNPQIKDTVIEVSCLYQVVNSLREIFHSDIITLHYQMNHGSLKNVDYSFSQEEPLSALELFNSRSRLADIWLDYSAQLKDLIQKFKERESKAITELALNSLAKALEQEKAAFDNRKKHLRSQKGIRALEKARNDIERQETRLRQGTLFYEEEEARERQLREKRWELEAHENRIDAMLEYVQREEKRMLNHIIPSRYTLNHIDLQPIAIKIILGEAHG
ncbi:MAG: hypothetical protein WBE11_03185, partial [Candidatus Aminicenantaceae bacterium]